MEQQSGKQRRLNYIVVSTIIKVGRKTLYYENLRVSSWPTEYPSDGQQIDEIIYGRFLLAFLLKLDSCCPLP